MAQTDAKSAVKILKQQNEKLKSELDTIKRSLNQAISTQKIAEMQSKRPNFSQEAEDKTIKALHKKLKKLKNERDQLRSQSSNGSEEANVLLTNEAKFLKSQLKEAQKEQKTLEKIIENQGKSFEAINQGQLSSEKRRELENEVKRTREEHKKISAKLKSEEQQWKLDHERMVLLKEKIREKKPRKELKKDPESDDEARDLKKKIEMAKLSNNTEKRKLERLLAEAQSSLASLKSEGKEVQKKTKKKEEEIQLKLIKIRQLKTSVLKLQKNINDKQKEGKDSSLKESLNGSDRNKEVESHEKSHESKRRSPEDSKIEMEGFDIRLQISMKPNL